jgi:hypothetical protein
VILMTKIMIQRHDMAILYDVIFDTCGLRDTIRGSMVTQLDILFIYYSINQYLSQAIGIIGKHRRSLISKVGTSSNSSFNLKFTTPICALLWIQIDSNHSIHPEAHIHSATLSPYEFRQLETRNPGSM